MPTVGPSLPPYLQKRKRSIDNYDPPNSPPRKVIAATAPTRVLGPSLPPENPDESDIKDDSSEGGHGPSIKGPSLPKRDSPLPRRILGPSLPPSKNPDELDLDDSSEDEHRPSIKGPSLPPKNYSSPRPKRVLGPAPPPASLSKRPSQPTHDSSDSSDDDDYGPSLPPAPGSAAHTAALERSRTSSTTAPSTSTAPPKPQREEWMLAPPSDSDWTSRIDTTKMKARKFASGKSASSKPSGSGGGISTIWTETPEEKRKRLEDEVLGRTELSTSTRAAQSSSGKEGVIDRESEETERRIREYNEKNRGRSLYEVNRERKESGKGEKKEEEDDPSKRGFDKEKDMALGGHMGEGQKRELLSKARDFGSRFQKGKFL